MEYFMIIFIMICLFIVLCAALAGLYSWEKECERLEEKLKDYRLRNKNLYDENYGLRIEVGNLKGLNEVLNIRIKSLETNQKGK